MNFRHHQGYRGEFFVAYEIPNTEDRDNVPCAATARPDGSHTFTTNVLYSRGDISFAVELMKSVLQKNTTWKGDVYRIDSEGVTVERMRLVA